MPRNDHNRSIAVLPDGLLYCARCSALYRRLITISALLALGLVSAHSSLAVAQTKAPLVLAVVNGDTITSRDLDEMLIDVHRTMGDAQRQGFEYRNLLKKLVNDRLLIQDAFALEMDQEPGLVEAVGLRRDRVAATLWVQDHFKPDVTIGEDAVRESFNHTFSRLQFRMVAVRSQELAQEIAAALRQGADMDSTARAISVDSYRTQGGLQKSKYRMDCESSLRDLADTLPPNGISDPIPYRGVYAIARIEQNVPADPAEYDSLKAGIESRLERIAYETQWRRFLDGLNVRFGLAVDTSALAAIHADSASLFTPDFTTGTDRPVITLAGETRVTDEQLRTRISHRAMTSGIKAFFLLLGNTIDELCQRIVLTTAAHADAYDEDSVVVREVDRVMDSALVAMYLNEIVAPRITFLRSEFESYYRENLHDFARPDQVQFERVLVDSEGVALELYGRLRDGADLGWVSERYDVTVSSPAESAEWLPLTALPEIVRQEVDSLRIGEYTTPRKIDQGWLILRLRARQPMGTLSLDEAEPEIRRVMFQRKFDAELDQVLSILKENSQIEYREDAISEYFGDGL